MRRTAAYFLSARRLFIFGTLGLLAPTLLIMLAFSLTPIGVMAEASFHLSEFGLIKPEFTLRISSRMTSAAPVARLAMMSLGCLTS